MREGAWAKTQGYGGGSGGIGRGGSVAEGDGGEKKDWIDVWRVRRLWMVVVVDIGAETAE